MALHIPMLEIQTWTPRRKPVENGQETVVVMLPPEGTPLIGAIAARAA